MLKALADQKGQSCQKLYCISELVLLCKFALSTNLRHNSSELLLVREIFAGNNMS